MNKWILVFAATAIGAATVPNKADAQIYVLEGARYCFYYDGWHGAGWYRCGYRWRQGLGWGGEYDWGVRFGWHHGGWERRHHVGGGSRFSSPSRSSGDTVIRGQTTTQERILNRGAIRSGSSPDVRSGTTGAGVPRGGGAEIRGSQGGMKAAPSGGGSTGGTVGGGGGGKEKP